MTLVENELLLTAKPARVWQTLLDFERYSLWHPYIRLTGEPKLGGTLGFHHGSPLRRGRQVRNRAVISRLEVNTAFEWQTGVARLFIVAEGFELKSHPSGTRLRHWLAYQGPIARLLGQAPVDHSSNRLSLTDVALRDYLAKKRRA
ncbi:MULTISPECIES: SRPBCC family protein [unclassified Sphingomonas]|uniref:SRPBCC family protein n=1 Tax=unclassified Sphingomonas TaxID=196159 RepID=UPI000830C25C|nr:MULTISPECIES: SRPBCC family protein [unclassified Sphingomonas]MBX3595250.1 SRPBCC family protein [Sphingomonas sp.]